MLRRLCSLIALTLLFLSAGAAAEAPGEVKEPARVALVIGNETYAEAPIANAASDARAVAEVLREGGFDVVYAENAGQAAFAEAIQTFAGKMERGAAAAVYDSGHAVQYDKRNILVAVDSKITTDADVRGEAIDMDLLLDPLIVARSPGSVAIIDASRQNPWARFLSSRARGLAAQQPLKGVTVIYAAAPGKVAASDAFASELVKSMKTPGLGFDTVISRTRSAVARATRRNQTVWQSSAPPKDLVILPVEASSKAPATAPGAVELGFWDIIKNSEAPGDFEIYLDSYPNGQFAAAGRARLAQLAGRKPEQAPTRSAALRSKGPAERPASPPAAPIRDCPVCP